MSARARVSTAIAVAAGTAVVFTALVLLAGGSPVETARALADGSLLAPGALGETLARSTALVLTALAAVVAFRSGVLNIGIEGQLLMGAAAGAALGPAFGGSAGLARVTLLCGAALAGAIAVLPAAWLAERRRVPAVLSTILLNLVAAAVVTWLVRGPLRDPAGDYPQSRPLPDSVRLGPLVAGSRVTGAAPLAFALAAGTAFLLFRTPFGLRLRAVGEAPLAARAAGLPDVRLRLAAFALSGGLAGLAGGLEVAALTGRLYDPFSAGVGYSGIAAALLGGLHPIGATLAALLFAALGAGAGAVQRDAGVPAALATLLQAVAVLALLWAKGRSR